MNTIYQTYICIVRHIEYDMDVVHCKCNEIQFSKCKMCVYASRITVAKSEKKTSMEKIKTIFMAHWSHIHVTCIINSNEMMIFGIAWGFFYIYTFHLQYAASTDYYIQLQWMYASQTHVYTWMSIAFWRRQNNRIK